MFSRILVGIDKSETGKALVEQAVFLAKPVDARLNFVHVITGGEPGYPMPLNKRSTARDYAIPTIVEQVQYASDCEAFNRRYSDWLANQIKQAKESGVKTEDEQLFGRPGQVLCNVAESWKADLILLGAQGHSGLSELLLGSVSTYVMHHAPCSVLVIHKNSVWQ